jgi:hypothetical protein
MATCKACGTDNLTWERSAAGKSYLAERVEGLHFKAFVKPHTPERCAQAQARRSESEGAQAILLAKIKALLESEPAAIAELRARFDTPDLPEVIVNALRADLRRREARLEQAPEIVEYLSTKRAPAEHLAQLAAQYD